MGSRGARWLLLALLLFELVVVSRQLARLEQRPPLVERAAVGALGPVARGVIAVEGALSDFWARRHRERWLRAENSRLRQRVGELERESLRRQSIELDFQRLAAAMRYSREASRPLRVGDVVFLDHSSARRSLLLFVGTGGAEIGQAVVDRQGVIGRVVVTSRGYAKAQLITDPASAVGAMIERTRRQGIARGAGPDALTLDYVPLSADVRVGDLVVSAGIDGIYPRGLPLGTVVSVVPGSDLFHRIEVEPAVDLGLLDGVYLLPRVDLPWSDLGDDDAGR